MNKPETPSPPQRRGTITPDRACEGSPPIDPKASSAGSTSPTPAGDPGILSPLEESALPNEIDDEVGRIVVVRDVTRMTDRLCRLFQILERAGLTVIQPMGTIQRKLN
jgi:hypothetical protein